MKLLSIGDKVAHVDYPAQYGKIVGKWKELGDTQQNYLVLWDNSGQSRHIAWALKKVE